MHISLDKDYKKVQKGSFQLQPIKSAKCRTKDSELIE